MMSSRTPGDLGVYGFRNRSDHSYDGLVIADGSAIRSRGSGTSRRGGEVSIVLGVPGTYPPRPLNGVMVSCFLTPSTQQQYTYPPTLRRRSSASSASTSSTAPTSGRTTRTTCSGQIYDDDRPALQLADHLLGRSPGSCS